MLNEYHHTEVKKLEFIPIYERGDKSIIAEDDILRK